MEVMNLYGCDNRIVSQDDLNVTFEHLGEIDGHCGHMCALRQTLTREQVESSKTDFPAYRPTE